MKRTFTVFLMMCVVSTLASFVHASIPKKTTEVPLQVPALSDAITPLAGEALIFQPYATGTLTYKSEELTWFAVVETQSELVGVLIISKGRRDYRKESGPDVLYIIEAFREKGTVASFLIFTSSACKPVALLDQSCEYKRFVSEVITKLNRIPDIGKVCVTSYVGQLEKDKPACSTE